MLLSKSDYKIASSCPKKLVYKKASYETKNDENEYMEMLAQSGYVVSKYAQLAYQDGIEVIGKNIDEVILKTKEFFDQNKNITLFEATFLGNNKIVRTDILQKQNNVINIIEVKSKSHDSEDNEYTAKRKLKEYIEDVAYQALVLKELYPEYEIHSFLLLPDKAKRTKIDGLAGWFTVTKLVDESFEIEELPARNVNKFKKPLVEFKYENSPDRDKYIKQLIEDNLLTLIPVDDNVNDIIEIVKNKSDQFIDILNNGLNKEQYSINKNCKECEFNLGTEKVKNGYRECWQELSDIDPHIFDLFFGGAIGSNKSGWYFDELISKRKVSFWDLDTNRFRDKKGDLGSRGQRQLLQFENTKTNTEWINPELSNILLNLNYPLHFIDFETYISAIPHHKGMRPYEVIAFQWSCHTIENPGSVPIHSEYLNTEHSFPNFRFAESLMKIVGTSGTPFMWTPYENTILRTILEQQKIHEYKNEVLSDWLINITSDKRLEREGRFVDMNDLTLKYYFHPDMKGKTSIKKVLPAIWSNNSYLQSNPWFEKYIIESRSNINPYDSLSPLINELESNEVIKEGTAAMRAYHELMFGIMDQDSNRKDQLKQLLLQYCELDTMAMVIIWKYWMDKFVLKK